MAELGGVNDMADYGNIGIVNKSTTQSAVVEEVPKKKDYYVLSWIDPKDKEAGHIDYDSSFIGGIKNTLAIRIPWYMKDGLNEYTIQMELSQGAVDNLPTETPKVYVNNALIAEGVAVTGIQDIVMSFTATDNYYPAVSMVSLVYRNNWDYRNSYKWYVPNSNGRVLNPIDTYSGSGGGGPCVGGVVVAANCPYPIGEKQPINYGILNLISNTSNTITFQISDTDVVDGTVTDLQMLFTLSTYADSAIADVFTSLGNNWKGLYAYDGPTSLMIRVESWNATDNYAKVWVNIPEVIDGQTKDIIIDFNVANLDNPDSLMISVVGF